MEKGKIRKRKRKKKIRKKTIIRWSRRYKGCSLCIIRLEIDGKKTINR
jgi:hypothetical protein